MTLVCQDCGSLNVTTDGAEPEEWFPILVTLSDQVPSEETCIAWLNSKGISDESAEQTATSMWAGLRWEPKEKAWLYKGKPHYSIWATFRSWCLRDLRQNGARPSRGLKIKEGYY